LSTNNSKDFDGREIKVNFARPRPPASSSASRGDYRGGSGRGGGGVESCRDFQRGTCDRGSRCRYSHGEPERGGDRYDRYDRDRYDDRYG
jgi:hypothetical protein